MRAMPPRASTAFRILSTATSVSCTASTAAFITPVWPTMSGLAMFKMTTSYFGISCTTRSASSNTDISGLRSYVATFGEGTSTRSSPGETASLPPLKKKVTCAYFSVSAMRSCFSHAFESTPPRAFFTEVKEDERVVLFDLAPVRPLGREHGDRLHEFVGDAFGVEAAHGLERVLRLHADALGHQVDAALHALPALVAVHRVVAPDDRRQVRLLGEVFLGGLRRRVAAVEDGVDVDLFRAERLARVDETLEVRLLGEVFLGGRRRRVAAVEDGVDVDLFRAERLARVDEPLEMRLQGVHAAVGQ